MKRVAVLYLTTILLAAAGGPSAQEAVPALFALGPTNHPSVPRELSQLWLVPASGRKARTPALEEFSAAVRLVAEETFSKALPILSKPSLREGPLGRYADYYKGLSELGLGRTEQARRTFEALRTGGVTGYLAEQAALREAESAEMAGDHGAAADIYERLASEKTTTATDDLLMRAGRAATAAGDRPRALRAFSRVYFEFPLSDWAQSAGAELDDAPMTTGSPRYRLQLERAERLFAAKRYEPARAEFERLRKLAQGDDKELTDIRVAECNYFLRRPRFARDILHPYIEQASRQAEVLYYHAVISRDLGNVEEFSNTVRRLADDFARESWTEEALNSLANYDIAQDDDAGADESLREMYERFPNGRNAERAAWKTGWWAYRNGWYAETVRVFEKAASAFPRSDYRPMWLYWSGRAHEALGESALAQARYVLAVTDYSNTYHGRLATSRLALQGVRLPERRLVTDRREISAGASEAAQSSLPPNAAVIRALLELELYDEAVGELRYAQKVWRDSSVIQATLAWIYVQQGQAAKGTERFNLLRGAINAMKRAYPQYLAAGGEELPSDILKIIYPLRYWDLIRKYAAEYNVDPFVAAALISQESTFVPDIKSYANAVGLTQLMPPTARQYAKTLNLQYSPRMLTNPEVNIRIGLAYLAAKIKEFGELHLALASYNAGERPVRRWVRERSGLEREEFIDDIPYAQTQNYVKKLLSTAEDYRRLYGPDASPDGVPTDAAALGDVPSSAPAPADAKPAAVSRPNTKKASAISPAATKKKRPRKAA